MRNTYCLLLLFILFHFKSTAYNRYSTQFLRTTQITNHAFPSEAQVPLRYLITLNQQGELCQIDLQKYPHLIPNFAKLDGENDSATLSLNACSERKPSILQAVQNINTKQHPEFLRKTSTKKKTAGAICGISSTVGAIHELMRNKEANKKTSAYTFLAGMIAFGAGLLGETLAIEKIKEIKEQIKIIEHNVKHVLKEKDTTHWTKEEKQKIKQLEKKSKVASAIAFVAICYTASRIVVFNFTMEEPMMNE